MGWVFFDVVRFDLEPFLQGQMRTAQLKSAYSLLIIGPRGLQCETNLQEIIGWESSDGFRFDLGPLLQGQMRTAKLKRAYNLLVIDPRALQYETNLWEIMGWESFDVVRFDLGLLLLGQTKTANLIVLITRLLLVLEVCNVKPTYRKSWAGNLLMFSDLTLGPSFKVK